MLIPRICSSLPKFLPQLFYIYARATCWKIRDSNKPFETTGSFQIQQEDETIWESDNGNQKDDGVETTLENRRRAMGNVNLIKVMELTRRKPPKSYWLNDWDVLGLQSEYIFVV